MNIRTKPLFGDFFKEKRIQKGLTLRGFCKAHRLDPGNISKLERGMLPPPESKKKLEEYASNLGLRRGKDDWFQFFDLAAASKGIIPGELMDNEELVRSLPLIFRTFRNKKISKQQVDDLIEILKRI